MIYSIYREEKKERIRPIILSRKKRERRRDVKRKRKGKNEREKKIKLNSYQTEKGCLKCVIRRHWSIVFDLSCESKRSISDAGRDSQQWERFLSAPLSFSDFHPGTELTSRVSIDRTLLINWTNSLDEIFSVRARERERGISRSVLK